MRRYKAPKVNILVAYPYFKEDVLKELLMPDMPKVNLMVDSGAFTAWNLGKPIKIDDYISFLKMVKKKIPYLKAVQLDVIGKEKETFENWEYMRKQIPDIMPVFTRGSDIRILEKYYKHSDYILIGGLAQGKNKFGYLKYFLKHNKGRKVHWLAATDYNFIKTYKPTSVDCSSWASASRYGILQIFDEAKGIKSFHRSDLGKEKSLHLIQKLKEIGFDSELLSWLNRKEAWVNSGNNERAPKQAAIFISICNWLLMQFAIRKNVGTEFYLAMCSKDQIKGVKNAYNYLKQRGIIYG